jgi:hypothetical protein
MSLARLGKAGDKHNPETQYKNVKQELQDLQRPLENFSCHWWVHLLSRSSIAKFPTNGCRGEEETDVRITGQRV